jgi:hypothetical protein
MLKFQTLTVFGPLKSCREDTVLVMVIHQEKPVGRLHGVHTSCSTGGGREAGNFKSLVTKDETVFKTFNFSDPIENSKINLLKPDSSVHHQV